MGMLGFFKKKDKNKESAFSSRKRRVVSSQGRVAAARGGAAAPRAAQPAPSSGSGPAPVAAEAAQPVGQLTRGDASALKGKADSTEADAALRDFIIEAGLGDPQDTRGAFDRKSDDECFVKILVSETIVNERITS